MLWNDSSLIPDGNTICMCWWTSNDSLQYPIIPQISKVKVSQKLFKDRIQVGSKLVGFVADNYSTREIWPNHKSKLVFYSNKTKDNVKQAQYLRGFMTYTKVIYKNQLSG